MKRLWLGATALAVLGVYSPSLSAIVCSPGWTALTGANWELCYRNTGDHGIEIGPARFKGKSVISRASQPFVLVPYQGNTPTFKDGLGRIPICKGSVYTLIPGTFSAGLQADDDNPGFPAFGDFAGAPAYSKLEISGIYDAGNYRYRQVFTFHGTGDVEFRYGFGGSLLNPKSHFHSPYWRVDFDVDVKTPNYFEQFSHPAPPPAGPGLNGADSWDLVSFSGAISGDPSVHQKWRVRSDVVNTQGEFHSWEIEPILGNPTEYTTANVWAMLFTGDAADGTVVGSAGCDDRELQTNSSYANNGLDDINGADLVVWISATEYHEVRNRGEESQRVPGFHYVGVHFSPRNFEDSTP